MSANSVYGITHGREQELVGKINAAASKLKSIRCTFVQTKHLSLLDDKMVSEGIMYYSRPDKLRWEYTSPYEYVFILNGTKVCVGNAKGTDLLDTGSNKVFKEIARIIMNTVTGKALSDAASFDATVADDGSDGWRVTLIPRKREMRQMFRSIEMCFNKSSLLVNEINIIEKNNDRTNIVFSNISIDTDIDASVFTVH